MCLAAWDEASWDAEQQGQGLDSAVDSLDAVAQPQLVEQVVEGKVRLFYEIAPVGALESFVPVVQPSADFFVPVCRQSACVGP